ASQVGGRLQLFSEEWRRFGSFWLNSVVTDGYMIPASRKPFIPKNLPEFFGAQEKEKVVHDHVVELLQKGAIYQVDESQAREGATSPLLLVKKKNGKLRPCLDLRYVNEVLPYKKFKLE